MTEQRTPDQPDMDEVEGLRRRLGAFNRQQVGIWRRMSGDRRLELVCQAYRLALETTRLTEHRRHPDLAPEELNWRVIRRMHGDLSLVKGVETKTGE